ncbi:MAG: hypothetical protein A2Z25_13000 [Planctomycetes bacterium RBG_16_55_9]|nr:MAG: hypothetical protein A2Z25_13000 [Planctomycetes bacterium RBG_16_55_9]
MVSLPASGEELGKGGLYSVVELSFAGPRQVAKDVPARDVDFWVRFQHESGSPEIKVHGFWDWDGKGGTSGNVFKVRLCPVKAGRWDLVEVYSNAQELNGQKQDDYVTATASDYPGFWIVDNDSPGRRWYTRSDESHQYIFGNTHYTFLSGYDTDNKPSGNDITADVAGNAQYFKKLRFSLYGDRYVNPQEKPFFDDEGRLTDSGDYLHRPNPRWFGQRADLAVQAAWENDLIADLILCGPDTQESRAVLRAGQNGGDPTPYLKYIAARYGSFPNVWMCLCNEFDIKDPKYSEEEIARFGHIIRTYLPYPTPLSVHIASRTGWPGKFDELPDWNDHQIIQKKIRNLPDSADAIQRTWQNPGGKGPRNKPTVNDELSYEGKGDKHTEQDTIESHLGAFLGGGYGTTGEKPANKLGQYFRGRFNPDEHTSADNLKYLREMIDKHVTFWKMAPDVSIFSNLHEDFRGLAWPGREYVLGTNKQHKEIVANLPPGDWTVKRFDIISKKEQTLSEDAQGRFTFDALNSRAVMFHFKKR